MVMQFDGSTFVSGGAEAFVFFVRKVFGRTKNFNGKPFHLPGAIPNLNERFASPHMIYSSISHTVDDINPALLIVRNNTIINTV